MATASSAALSSITFRGPGLQHPKQPQVLRRISSSISAPNQPPKITAALPLFRPRGAHNVTGIFASISSNPRTELRTGPGDLVDSIISKVTETDRGVLLTRDEHKKVAEIAQELRTFCVDKPVKCPLIFGEWDVVYCSVPTSPGGGYRSALGRLIFKTKEMIQVIEAPNSVRNKVSFSAFGFLDGEVSLEGKLKAVDEKWIQVVFEPPEVKVGALELKYGSQ
ncbi:putative plastid-lipid-associated protein 8, chloroplastic, partial [Sarracenia purpurea var. burkii]